MREERLEKEHANRPHVVLGTRPGEDHKWTSSDLAKCILTEEQLLASPTPVRPVNSAFGAVPLPSHLNYGVTKDDAELLFSTLPALASEVTTPLIKAEYERKDPLFFGTGQDLVQVATEARKIETGKAEMLARIVDLRNANAGGIAYENRRRIVEAFSEPANPGDVGRTEVQSAFSLNYLVLFLCLRHRSRRSCNHDFANSNVVVPPHQSQEGLHESAEPSETYSPTSEDAQVSQAEGRRPLRNPPLTHRC